MANYGTTLGTVIGRTGTAAGGGRGPTGNGTSVELLVTTPEGDYLCQTSKPYTEKASIVQELDSSDGFLTLSQFLLLSHFFSVCLIVLFCFMD